MAFNGDWGNKPYIGVFVDDAAANAYVVSAQWTLADGLNYFNSTIGALKYYSSGNWHHFGSSWLTYVASTMGEPVLHPSQPASGSVYTYQYSDGIGGTITLYRFVPDPYVYSNDRFYDSWDGTTLSGLRAVRSLPL
jgi:hypothetical protein